MKVEILMRFLEYLLYNFRYNVPDLCKQGKLEPYDLLRLVVFDIVTK